MSRNLLKTKHLKVLDNERSLCYNEDILMRIDSEELRRRLNSTRNLGSFATTKDQVSGGSVESATAGSSDSEQSAPPNIEHRYKAKPHRGSAIPEEVKETIGTLASLPGAPKQSEIGAMFGFDQRQVSNFKTGKNSGNGYLPPDESTRAKIATRENKIKDAALLKVMQCLDLLGPEKLEDLDAKGLAKVGSDMAKIASSFEERESNSNINIVVYTPETRNEKSYKTIEI